MNLIDRNLELDKARIVNTEIASLQRALNNADDDEGEIKNALAKAQAEFKTLADIGERTPRIWELHEEISDLQDQLRNAAHAPSTIENSLRKKGSEVEGYRARDHIWLQAWRIGKEPDMGAAIDVENLKVSEEWLREVRVHVTVFLSAGSGRQYLENCEGKLNRRRIELAAGRNRNAEADEYAARLRAGIEDEKQARIAAGIEADKKLYKQRAKLEAEREKKRKEDKRKAKLAFDRKAAKRQYKVYLQEERFFAKIAQAREDPEFRDAWVLKVAQKDRTRASRIDQLSRRHSPENARRGSESFALLREKWENIVDLLKLNPPMRLSTADQITEDAYQDKREALSAARQAELDAHNASQVR